MDLDGVVREPNVASQMVRSSAEHTRAAHAHAMPCARASPVRPSLGWMLRRTGGGLPLRRSSRPTFFSTRTIPEQILSAHQFHYF